MGSKIVGAIPTVVANKIITRDRMIDILYFDMEKNILTRECIELIHKFFSLGNLSPTHNVSNPFYCDHVLKTGLASSVML